MMLVMNSTEAQDPPCIAVPEPIRSQHWTGELSPYGTYKLRDHRIRILPSSSGLMAENHQQGR